MREKIQKFGQDDEEEDSEEKSSEQESSFTKSDFATAIHQLLQGINDFASLGMVSKGVPSVLSNIIGFANQILVADIGANYLQIELSNEIYNNKKIKNEIAVSADTIISSFSTSVAPRINSAFNKFKNFIQYSNELLKSENISADPAVIDKYSDLKQIILRSKNNPRKIKKELYNLIDEISKRLDILKNIAGVEFSLIKQFLNLDSAVNINLDVDLNTFSKDKYDLDNLSKDLVSKLSPILKELKNLEVIINVIKNISSDYPTISAVSISGKSNKKKTDDVGSKTPTSGKSIFSIDKIYSINSLNQDTPYSYKLSGLTSVNPSVSLEISGNFSKQQNEALNIFNILVNTKNIILNDGSGMANPPRELTYIVNQLKNPNSGLLSLTPVKNTANYILTISIPIQAAKQLMNYPSIYIFKILINGQNYFIKSANTKYVFNSNISEISFNINDLIDHSSNISKIDRQKILNKLKK